jgi:hypothetical protein
MDSLQDQMLEYKSQLEKGFIQQAYRGLMQYMLALRSQFQKNYPDYDVPGNLYAGYMDMTYLAVIPAFLKERRLKAAVVFLHENFRFEVWLSGYNRQVQAQYWQIIKDAKLQQYRLVADPLKADSILEHVLVDNPDFRDLAGLTHEIEEGTIRFISDIESYLK